MDTYRHSVRRFSCILDCASSIKRGHSTIVDVWKIVATNVIFIPSRENVGVVRSGPWPLHSEGRSSRKSIVSRSIVHPKKRQQWSTTIIVATSFVRTNYFREFIAAKGAQIQVIVPLFFFLSEGHSAGE